MKKIITCGLICLGAIYSVGVFSHTSGCIIRCPSTPTGCALPSGWSKVSNNTHNQNTTYTCGENKCYTDPSGQSRVEVQGPGKYCVAYMAGLSLAGGCGCGGVYSGSGDEIYCAEAYEIALVAPNNPICSENS